MKLLKRNLGPNTIKRIVRERSRTLAIIHRKMDRGRGRASKSPLLNLRRKFGISMGELSKGTGIDPKVLRKIEADAPGMIVDSRTLIRLAKFFGLRYWKGLVTGDV